MKGSTRKRGNVWSYYFDLGKIDGKRQKHEKSGFATKADAEAALAAAVNEYNNAGQVFSPSEMTVSDYLDFWFNEYVKMNLKYNTQLDYIQIIESHLKPVFGAYKLKALNAAAVQEYANDLKRKGFAKATLTDIICALSGSLNYAVEPLHYIQYNPCNNIRYPKYENGRQELHVFIKPEDMRAILQRYPETSPFYIPLMLGYYTGIRISECFGLTWDDIDLEKRTLSISRQTVKRNFGMDVRKAINKGRERMEKSEWYFQTPKTPTSTRTIKFGETLCTALKSAKHNKQKNRLKYGEHFIEYYIKPEPDEKGETVQRIIPATRALPVNLPICDLVCVRDDGSRITSDSFKVVCRTVHHDMHMAFNYHSLRHTHATMLIQAGANIKDVQERLGHADIQTTMNRYVHNTDRMKDQTVDIFEQAVNKMA